MTSVARHPRHRARRGLTFLEVTLAIALIATLAATMMAGFNGIRRWSILDRERLNAMEVAHKVVLIYAKDGPEKIPNANLPIQQGAGLYRFVLTEQVLRERDADEDATTVREAALASRLTANERIQSGLVMITVDVFPDASTAITNPNVPLATLSRVFDPFSSASDDVLLNHVLRLLDEQGASP